MMKSAEARLQATEMFQTTARRRRAFYIGVVGLRLQGIQEEDHQVDQALGNEGAELPIPTEGAALEQCKGDAVMLLQQTARRPDRREIVLG